MRSLPSQPQRPLTLISSTLALASVLLVLAGCASVPDATTTAPTDPATLASAQTLKGEAGAWPEQAWWRGFNDPQLNALMDEAFANSPDMLAASARLKKARAFSGQVKAAMEPDARFNASIQETKQSLNMGFPPSFKDFLLDGYHPSTRITVEANYDLDLWGKSKAAVRGAAGQQKATELEAVVVRQNLSVAIARAYVELNHLYETRDYLADLKHGADVKLELYQARADRHLEPQDTVLRARDEQAQVAGRIAAVDGAIAAQGHLIATLTGAGPDRALRLTRPNLAPADTYGLPDDVHANLLGRRPDVLAARLRVEAQGQNIKYTQADYYPNVKLSAYFGLQAIGIPNLTNDGSDIGGIGPAFSLPLFHQKRLDAAYRSAEADYDLAVADYDTTLTRALQDVANAANGTRTTVGQVKSAQARRDSAEDGYQLSSARFQRGLATKMEILTAHANVVTADSALSDLKAQAYNDRISFIAALGGGYASK
ncbi:efflux transporter outer membrane subunit [Asticcacaulis biprosthecium]|uniref:efflux transporter outer membrane subunit n=1 Tax=Asticcacaulis biprosthecium TaxID=76891 RepID=UPI000A01B45F|nr:efflux transporter outer membrane subunit [Asticcacaulis biprosthecium]